MDKGARHKSGRAQEQTYGISHLAIGELGQDGGPQHRADGLHGKQYAHPVAGRLVALGGDIGGTPHVGSHRAIGVCPHIHERNPAEKLYHTNFPERGRSVLEQFDPVATGLVLTRGLGGCVVLLVLFW